jgi:hypothetical protein
LRLVQPAVQMAATKTGKGYWFVASDGGVFSFGDAKFHGSMGGRFLAAPMVGIVPTSTGRGYWLAAADGGIFSFGDARFRGSLGGVRLVAPIVAAAPTTSNRGYWLVGQDGGVFSFGDAKYRGRPIGNTVDIASLPDGTGYVSLSDYGVVRTFSSERGAAVAQPFLNWHAGAAASGIAVTPDGKGEWVVTTGRAKSNDIAAAQGRYFFLMRQQWNRCAPATWWLDPANKPDGAEAFFAELFDYTNRVTGMQFHFGGAISPVTVLPPNAVMVGFRDLAQLGRPDASGVGYPMSADQGFFFLSLREKQWAWRAPDTGHTAIHELGHAMGLDHNFGDYTSVMDYNQTQWRFGPGDLAGLREQLTCR